MPNGDQAVCVDNRNLKAVSNLVPPQNGSRRAHFRYVNGKLVMVRAHNYKLPERTANKASTAKVSTPPNVKGIKRMRAEDQIQLYGKLEVFAQQIMSKRVREMGVFARSLRQDS